jgi:hypothetical protein
MQHSQRLGHLDHAAIRSGAPRVGMTVRAGTRGGAGIHPALLLRARVSGPRTLRENILVSPCSRLPRCGDRQAPSGRGDNGLGGAHAEGYNPPQRAEVPVDQPSDAGVP